MMRASGILLPISSIPSNYGIGCFSKEAYAFVDQLAEAGQKFWQILPLGPTGYGDSPYQSFSTFAGNPYFIDLEEFIQRDLLTAQVCSSATGAEVLAMWIMRKSTIPDLPFFAKAYHRFYQMDTKKKELELLREAMEALRRSRASGWRITACIWQ